MRLSGWKNALSALLRIVVTGAALLMAGCGETYRPVAQPIEGLQPSPAAAHAVIALNTDGVTNNSSGNGTATNINVSGDTVQGNLTAGLAPAHAAIAPNGSKLFIANSGEDSVTVNTTSSPAAVAATVSLPASASAQITSVTGSGSTATYTYTGSSQLFFAGDIVYISGCSTPGFNGVFGVVSASAGSFTVNNSTAGSDSSEGPGAIAKAPNAVFVAADNSNAYVAGYSTNSVYVINSSNVVSATVSAGTHPVALAELPNGQAVFAVNQGNVPGGGAAAASISLISTVNDTVTQSIALPSGCLPVWAVAKADSSRVYVVDETGAIYDIDPSVAAINCTASPIGCVTTAVTAGANFATFDPILNRLYVTNPIADQAQILDASTDPPKVLNTLDLTTVCPGCAPDSATVLGDGSRAYVGAYQFAPGCTDYSGSAVNCVNSVMAVIDGPSATLKSIISSFGSGPALGASGCGAGSGPPPTIWQPGTARLRVSVASSGGGANSKFKVFVGQCDAGSVAVIDTYPANGNVADTYSGISLNAPLSTLPPLSSGYPPPENPVFVLAGP